MTRDHGVQFFQVDAFTSEMFRGNPAAVVLPEDTLPDSLCSSIAAEMNLSETAFIHALERKEDNIPRFGLRWFTPTTEVDLCGHGTLATAKVLFEEIGIDSEVLAFETRSGPLFAHRAGTSIRLDLPSDPSTPTEAPEGLEDALGRGDWVHIEGSGGGFPKLVVELGDGRAVRGLRPDFKAMMDIGPVWEIAGIVVTARGDEGFDFVSRCFVPWMGVDEDPVTGAAHTTLGPYWAGRLGKKEMRAAQLSKRGGEIIVRPDGERVHLTGEAVIVLEGTICLV